MLKIKDNIDLKELEKFAFKPKYNEDTGKIVRYVLLKHISKQNEKTKYSEKAEIEYIETIEDYGDFYKQHTVTYWKITYFEFEMLEVLYDLIQAGLVEKI